MSFDPSADLTRLSPADLQDCKDDHTVNDNSGPETRKWMEAIVRDTFAYHTTEPR